MNAKNETANRSTEALELALADLPVKLRVHELAKRAGVPSKEVIAGLAAAGVTVGSAASSVGVVDATNFLTTLLGSTGALPTGSAPPAPPVPTAGAAADAEPAGTPDLVGAVARSTPEQDPGFFAAPLFLPPAEAKPTRRRRSTKTAAVLEPALVEPLPAGTVADLPVEPVTEAVKADGADPADTSPDAASLDAASSDAASSDTGSADAGSVETGTSRSGRRRRGRSGGRGRTDSGDDHQEEATATDVPSAGSIDDTPPEIGEADNDTDTDTDIGSDGVPDDDDQAARRRRRRGRRGRGRASEGQDENDTDGESSADAQDNAAEAQPSEGEPDEEGDDESNEEGGTRRRRRRRRRTGAPEAGADETNHEDDPDNTVVHVREPRTTSDRTPVGTGTSEVQGIRGSTRLEAKRQRRREGRGSRSRPQILTEAEFLARREAVERVMAVRQRGDLAQVALLEDGVLVEHFVSQAGSESLMGNIYLGRVQNVLPSMEAAFVDIGKGRNAVLYAGEVNWDAAGLAGKARRIEIALSGGDTMLVQVSKDPVGQKGARLTTQISLPGRFLVYVPGGGATGISRKLPDTERKRLKSILDRIVPEDAGVIIRTAAEGVAEEELARDVERLKSQWEEISRQAEKKSNAPLLLSAEPDTLIKVVRDLFNSDITRLILDGDRAYEPVAAYIDAVAPELSDRVSRYDGPNDVFAAYRIDEQIAKALERKVYLPSGGSLVIDRTEAMTVVDVNTGKYTGSGGNLEETVTKNNLEAAEEVVRQLRLRDIGGIIVVDFIDMVLESNRELVMRRLTECLGRDRTRHQVAEVTSLGLIQMTRKKMGTGLVEAFSEPCPHCHGRGIILHDVPVQDHSGGNAGGDNRAQDTGDSDARGGRNRRARGRQDAPALEQAVVKTVPATVRPPDPRGPKPPTRGGDDHHETNDQPGTPGDSGAANVQRPAAVIEVAGGRAIEVPVGSDASFNAPRSRDASDAVSAVFAALDAQVAAQAPTRESAGSSAAAGFSAGAGSSGSEAEPATAGRRRGRRSAGRPAGAPAGTAEIVTVAAAGPGIVESTEPVQVEVAAAVDEVRAAAAVHDVEIQSVDAAPAAESAPGAPAVTAPEVAPAADLEEPKKGRAPARRRGSRAAGAAVTAAVTEPTSTPSSGTNGAVTAGDAAPSTDGDASPSTDGAVAPATNGASAPASGGPAATGPEAGTEVGGGSAPAAAPAPRRRRAASRPAGPAGAPAPVDATVQ